MANAYSWSDVKSGRTSRLPGPEHLGWWIAVAIVISVLLHIIVFILFGWMDIGLEFRHAEELRTSSVNMKPIEVRPTDEYSKVNPEVLVTPPKNVASLLEEIDVLAALPKDHELDMRPDIKESSFAIQMNNPLVKGEPTSVQMENTADLVMDSELPELGREPQLLKPAEVGQVTIDPGTMQKDDDLGKFTDELLKRGAQGKVEKGTLDGIASLDELLGLPANVLVSKTTMLPSDLLFEFNKADLRESAKVGLMKLALLMDRNPTLYCWIEGHADLIGSDAFNQQLSMKRADAVKTYLVKSLRMDGDKIIPRGFGKSHPLVKGGTANEQAPNRRVEIRMRQTPPPKDQPAVAPPDEVAHPAQVVHPNPPAPPAEVVPPTLVSPPKAVLVTPRRALPVEEEVAPPVATPRAEPVDPDSLLPPGE